MNKNKVKTILISPEMTIKQTLKRMDEVGEKTLFAVDNDGRLQGAVTDGDIRRWILRGNSLDSNVTKVINKNPFFLREKYSKEEARDLMLSKVIECLPIVDEEKRVVNAIWWLDLFENKFKTQKSINIPVVIMAGGEGTRLSPITNILPKSLIPIGDKPIIELIIDRFVESGCSDFYLSVNYKANILKAYFADFHHNSNINYIQEDKPLGTAGSLHLLENKIRGTFFVTNCDTLIEADYPDMLEFHKANNNKITLVVSMKHYTIPYGICDITNGGILKTIQEKPEYDFLANTGMYLMEHDVLGTIPKNTFYNITDLISDNIKKDNKIGVYPISEKSWLDMGGWQELQKNLLEFKHKNKGKDEFFL